MDLSKLPKLSKTPTPPQPDTASDAIHPAGGAIATSDVICSACGGKVPSGQRFCGTCGADWTAQSPPLPRSALAAEAWISVGLGIILLFVSPRVLQYWRLHGHPEEFEKQWQFWDKAGAPLAYTKTAFYIVDVAVFLFAAVLIFEGLALIFSRTRVVVLAALLSTVVAVGVNVYALATTYREIGFSILPALAVAMGGYMAFYQWAAYQSLPGRRR